MTVEDGYQRRPLKVGGSALAALAFSTLGVIYSDIGTSPLYVLNGIWAAGADVPNEEDIIGGISAIVWAITLLPLVKYVIFALEFGTVAGEGGPFALYMSLFPRKEPQDDRSLTTFTTDGSDGAAMRSAGRSARLRRDKWPLFCWALFGTALTLADGILTPPVSVSTAVSGIAVAVPSAHDALVGISCAFLIALFAIQRLGTSKIGFAFAPVTAIWLLLLGGTGIYNIVAHPGIWRAYDPSRAVLWFVRTKNYDQLNGVLLAITGCEAMFANLAQFNKAAIRIAFAGLVYPMLVLQYLGQGARLIKDPGVLDNMFYKCIPGPTGGALYWVMFIFAILAALTASQAMISGTFALVHQLVGMRAFPAVRITHTSDQTSGQIYIGAVNWLLLIGCIAITAGFGSDASINYAYGFAVATVTFVTTTLIALSIPVVKALPVVLGLLFLVFFGFLDGLFWGAALKKVPHGAWVPLMVGLVLITIMCFWTWGGHLEDRFESANHERLADVISRDVGKGRASALDAADHDADHKLAVDDVTHVDEVELDELHGADVGTGLRGPAAPPPTPPITEHTALFLHRPAGSDVELARLPIFAIFHRNARSGRGIPHSFVAFLRSYPALPEIIVFLTTRVVGVPHVPEAERYVVDKVRSYAGVFTVAMRVGYREAGVPDAAALVERIAALEARTAASPDDAAARVAAVHRVAADATHVVPSYHLVSSAEHPWAWRVARRFLLEDVYGRARVIFPDRQTAPERDNTLHVMVAAVM